MLPLLALLALGGAALYAQIEPGERGIPPINSSSSFEVPGVDVDVVAKSADLARSAGWREAQRKGWKMLWGRMNSQPATQAPSLPDSTLDSIVAGIVIENEQIGPHRYIARLGVQFDRARTGGLLGVRGEIVHSPPMLVIPVVYSASTPTSFELRNPWQEAWARFRPGGSPIDYVRVSGTGADPLLLNAMQAGRPGRGWWRMLLDQYGAADMVVPVVSLRRVWPGGPVIGTFIARHGPDGEIVDSFTLRVESSDALPKMLDEGVRRIDAIYAQALREGRLGVDNALVVEQPSDEDALAGIDDESIAEEAGVTTTVGYSVQVDTPDAAALGAAESALRALPGAGTVATTSLALGGVSVIRVGFQGDMEALRMALVARGWRADVVGDMLRIARQPAGAGAPPAAPPKAPPAKPAPPPAPPKGGQ